MKRVTLFFPSIDALWQFRKIIVATYFEINPKGKTLTCDCNEEHINIALIEYGAIVVNNEENRSTVQ
ncbi:MAG TPA: hypothetical protein VGO09_09225 [Flavisolibacter sp.]|nr:hypothetical protein [Flavisolibacter sp.]